MTCVTCGSRAWRLREKEKKTEKKKALQIRGYYGEVIIVIIVRLSCTAVAKSGMAYWATVREPEQSNDTTCTDKLLVRSEHLTLQNRKRKFDRRSPDLDMSKLDMFRANPLRIHFINN